jgi:hypothetical protein
VVSRERRYRSVADGGTHISTEDDKFDDTGTEPTEPPTRARAWTQIVLISVGVVVVGVALLVVLWLLFTLTFSLIDEAL